MASRFQKTDCILLIPILAVLPWLWVMLHFALNTNHAWLSVAAERLLAGGRMSTDFYDPDPPLSILIYLPVVLASRWTGIALYYMPALFGIAGLILSATAIWLLLVRFETLGASRRVVILSGFLMAATYLTANEAFGERDGIVAFGLFPFMLAQLALTYKIQLPRWLLWPVMVLGAFAILVKPHYGLLPTLLLLHRAVRQKRLFSMVFDIDFMALAVAVLMYAAVLLVFFQDYLHIILPDLHLYLAFITPYTPQLWFMVAGLVVVGAGATYLLEVNREDSRPAYLCFLASFICSCLYLLQMKGFFYHLIPTFVFGYAGAGLMVLGLIRKLVHRDIYATLLAVVIITAAAVFYLPAESKAVTHDEYRNLPLAKVAEACAPDCSVFIFSETMEMVHQVTIYTGVTHASRFPELWWMVPLMDTANGRTPEGRAAQAKLDHYEGLMIEDLERYRPQFLILDKRVDFIDRPSFYFRNYFSRYPNFNAVMKHYRLEGVLHDNRDSYFKDTSNKGDHPIDYEIYKRID